MNTNEISKAAAALGRKGGSSKSESKTIAAQANGLRGGRPRITALRKIAGRLGFSVYPQGSQWILQHRETEPLHYSIRTERDALLVGLRRAEERGMLTKEESAEVASA